MGSVRTTSQKEPFMGVVSWLMAAILVIVGIGLSVVGCLVGPDGYSISQRRA
jgi:hypothetical protein